MCGIVGYSSTIIINDLSLLNSLNHRGPDSQGLHNYNIGNKNIGIGHTRLKIIDLSENGKQPMLDESQQVVLSFNGEIYNFKQLKEKYLKNEVFNSQTDTEVILKLYLKFAWKFLEELNGDFAIALLDKRINKMFLVRDRVGVKPLYFFKNDQLFAFGSEIKALFESGVPRKINITEIQNYFIFKYSPQDKTLIEGIHRLKPGSILTFDLTQHSFSIANYWELAKSTNYSKISYGDAKIELRNLIQNAVESRLEADVPIGNFLSGGLDSSIIAYYLQGKPEIKHYCATKNQNDLIKEGSTSDGKYAQLLSQKWKLDLTNIPISANETNVELIKTTLRYADDLIADGSQIPSYLITKKAKENSTVMLSGMGADELFLGYAGHQISFLADKIDQFPSFFKTPLYKWMKNLDQGKGKFLAYRRYLHKLGKNGSFSTNKFAHFNLVGDVTAAKSIFTVKGNADEIFVQYFKENEPLFDAIFHFEYENFLQKNLHYLDRMTMANGVEARVPFLDHRIIELAYNLPLNYKLSSFGKTKKILKDIYKNDLPKEIINRRKAGFGMPLRSIFSNRSQITNLLNLEFFASFDGFDIQHIRRIIDLHIDGKEDHSALIYALISFQYWYEIHIENK